MVFLYKRCVYSDCKILGISQNSLSLEIQMTNVSYYLHSHSPLTVLFSAGE